MLQKLILIIKKNINVCVCVCVCAESNRKCNKFSSGTVLCKTKPPHYSAEITKSQKVGNIR